MVFKLLKYDFKSMLRVFIPLWLALLAVSAINHFSVSATSSYADSLIWDMKAIAMLVFFGRGFSFSCFFSEHRRKHGLHSERCRNPLPSRRKSVF